MKRFLRLAVYGLLIFFSFLASAAPNYEVIYKTQQFRMSQEQIIAMVNDALLGDTGQTLYSDVITYVHHKEGDISPYLVVDLLQPNQFGIATFRLDLNADCNKVTRVERDYVESEPLPADACGTCPDAEVQVLIGYISEFQSSTYPAVNKVENALKKANLKYKKLLDGEENKNSLLNYLSCPKLVMWCRVGHGNLNVIRFGPKGKNGNMSADEFLKEPFKSLIKGKYFPFCSCYVAGKSKAVVGRNLIQSGGRWMCGGDDVAIAAGPSEPAWANFLVEVCNGTEVNAAYNKTLKKHTEKWGFISDGTGPYYPFKGVLGQE